MVGAKLLVVLGLIGFTFAQHSAVDVALDVYGSCLKDFSISCVKPKALAWMNDISEDKVIKITNDLIIVKKDDPEPTEETRGLTQDVFDKFEDFLQTHELVAKVPEILRADGPLGSIVPRAFQPQDLSVPLASTGRSKVVKKVILPFLLGLKFKTAVLVPLALTLIALKTWKALTFGLLSLVLTAAMVVFKFTKPKVVNYEVIHYPHHDHHDHHFDHHDHHEHHVEHAHIDHAPVASGWDNGYGRQMTASEIAYNAYNTEQ